MTLNYISFITFFGYLGLGTLQILPLFGIPWLFYRSVLAHAICLGFHGWGLYLLIDTPNGQNMHWIIMLSLVFWLVNILIVLNALRDKNTQITLLTYPLTALIVAASLILPNQDSILTNISIRFLAHIFISLLAISLLTFAGLQALFMGLQQGLLKQRPPAPFLRDLPPLQRTEALLFQTIGIGSVLLFASLISGFLYPALFTQGLMLKIMLALCASGLLILLMLGRYRFGWRGRTAIRWTLSGTLLTFLSYFGSKLFL